MEMTPEDLPNEIGRGKLDIGGFELEVIQLDNGQRLIAEESLQAFFRWVEAEAE